MFSAVIVVAILIIVSPGAISSTSVPIIVIVRMISITAPRTISSALGVVISLIAGPRPVVVSVRVQEFSPLVSTMNRAGIIVVESLIVAIVSTSAIMVSITATATASSSIASATST
jgi:hypothetical protein